MYLIQLHSQLCPYLTVCPEACFLQPGPDALDAAGVLWMTGGVATHTLVLLHQRVVHQPWKEDTRKHAGKQSHCRSLTAITTHLFWCDHPFHYRHEVMWRDSSEIRGFCAVNYTCTVKGPRIPSNSLVQLHSSHMRAHHVVWLSLTCNQQDESAFLDCCLPLYCMTDLFASADQKLFGVQMWCVRPMVSYVFN